MRASRGRGVHTVAAGGRSVVNGGCDRRSKGYRQHHDRGRPRPPAGDDSRFGADHVGRLRLHKAIRERRYPQVKHTGSRAGG